MSNEAPDPLHLKGETPPPNNRITREKHPQDTDQTNEGDGSTVVTAIIVSVVFVLLAANIWLTR